jgi:hypothetical protein
MDCPSYLYAELDGTLLARYAQVRFFGEPLRSSGVSFAD